MPNKQSQVSLTQTASISEPSCVQSVPTEQPIASTPEPNHVQPASTEQLDFPAQPTATPTFPALPPATPPTFVTSKPTEKPTGQAQAIHPHPLAKLPHHLRALFHDKDIHGRSLMSRYLSRMLVCASPTPTARFIIFIHNETVLCLAALIAFISVFFTRPDLGNYLSYIDFRVLEMLFCLMATAAGLQRVGFFKYIAHSLHRYCQSQTVLANLLVMLCLGAAMFITNDVALIVFVPFTLQVLDHMEARHLIFVIVMETVAANLGSMLTPIGNPQNIFLYSFYNLDPGQFLKIVWPWFFIILVLIQIYMRIGKIPADSDLKAAEPQPEADVPTLDKPVLSRYLILLFLCLLAVAKLISPHLCLGITLAWLLAADREVLKHIDYLLLLTFVCFFIFVGNTSQISWVKEAVGGLIIGHELYAGALLSQLISNVPAAVMLASFTPNGAPLLLGVNLGGLGTLVASLASLISYRLYKKSLRPDDESSSRAYLWIFSWVNFSLLAILLGLASIIYRL
ncbi:MAG: anion permease [bacterium]|nr:anion permease [bacterium]